MAPTTSQEYATEIHQTKAALYEKLEEKDGLAAQITALQNTLTRLRSEQEAVFRLEGFAAELYKQQSPDLPAQAPVVAVPVAAVPPAETPAAEQAPAPKARRGRPPSKKPARSEAKAPRLSASGKPIGRPKGSKNKGVPTRRAPNKAVEEFDAAVAAELTPDERDHESNVTKAQRAMAQQMAG